MAVVVDDDMAVAVSTRMCSGTTVDFVGYIASVHCSSKSVAYHGFTMSDNM